MKRQKTASQTHLYLKGALSGKLIAPRDLTTANRFLPAKWQVTPPMTHESALFVERKNKEPRYYRGSSSDFHDISC
ncbi:hypothetical protein [Laceyella sacchari]|uniref:hypothetical protein n=1 Tax=Laceyella sacchari TaxID=37482 RepID=UPI001045B4C1|nr:hypothetical protein [Laceyella sacchari]